MGIKKDGKPGRPTKKEVRYRNVGRRMFDGKDTKEVLEKLEQAFSIGCTDLEACLLADISQDQLYNYQRKNPDFIKRKEVLKNKPILKARTEVIKGLENDKEFSFRFLERKAKGEFAPKSEVEHSGSITLNSILDEIENGNRPKAEGQGVEAK